MEAHKQEEHERARAGSEQYAHISAHSRLSVPSSGEVVRSQSHKMLQLYAVSHLRLTKDSACIAVRLVYSVQHVPVFLDRAIFI